MTLFLPLLGEVEQKIIGCFREGGGLPYSEFPRFHALMAEQSGVVFDSALVDVVLPLVDGLPERLRSGADVADFGCGSGHAINVMAQAFPASRFTGIDFSDEAIADRRPGGGSPRSGATRPSRATTWRELDKTDAYDVITVFDAIHDQAQPARVLENIYRALRPGGVLLMADIKASSRLEDNVGVPMSTYLYTTSLMHCMTVSLALDGAGLGTAWGTQLATSMLGDAGFGDVRVAEIESDPINNYYFAFKGPGSLMAALDALDDWPVPAAAAAVIGPDGVLASHGDTERVFELASVTKPLVARAVQVAIEEGVVDLDTAAGPPGSTIRHLLAHASGLAMHSDQRAGQARHPAHLLQLRLHRAGPDRGARVGHRVRPLPGRGGVRTAGHGGHPAGRRRAGRRVRGDVHGGGPGGFRRRPAAPGDRLGAAARRGDDGAISRPGRRVARLRRPAPQRLGAGFRDQGREIAALDRRAQLAANVRPFRPGRGFHLGRSRTRTWRWWPSPTAISASGRCGRGRRFPTR